ncbi:FecCD family ABC transporter permease [Streptomyces sp. NBC_01508]|uniref:FecCD family ABC transporter permease n=1 Tax=Streptomyces sp. NBC_01508 TaxID=2903888 RepID=UPI003863CF3E
MTLHHPTPTQLPETGTPATPPVADTGRLHRPPAVAALCAALALVLAGSVLLAISLGPAPVAPGDTARFLWAAIGGGRVAAADITTYQIIWEIRTPRVLLAALVGAGLSAVGVAIQAMVRNALADPFVLGVSSGASVGAVGVTVTGGLAGLGVYAVSAGAFAGALFASLLVYLASSRGGALSPLRLVLTGVCVSFGLQAVMSVLIYLAPSSEAAGTVLYWTMGSFGAASWAALPVVTAAVLLGIVLLHRRSRSLDVMALGDETAVSLGISPDRHRRLLLVLASLLTGVMVAVSGAISFVGLIVPHLVRLVVGAGHARVLAVAPPAGAVFLVWADLIARTLVAPRELPLGVITALVGVPVFITLMRRKSYVFGGR